MAKREFSETVRAFGEEVGRLSYPLYTLGIMCAQAAADNMALEEDARKMFEVYHEARRRAAGLPRPADAPSPVQISKIKKFFEVGARLKQPGVEMLREMYGIAIAADGSSTDLYNACITAGRRAIEERRPLTEEELKTIIIAERRGTANPKRK
ncbi:hypothetical protein [Methylocystis parvus]|uniref:Uncharacterized protein n=1 Tax=Methylocystis parvus TaxID=134 RepID=A0A6B8M418_9HYPH|nr:hypothetical protein [Methylocystis parvus]QGM96489.1 hypothetical protein F7D14_02665 [Methylocystis parvus]WBJ99660.1 hypothetical protein MMG94_16965 [Methylocystis parvus OBBP]